LPFLLGELAKKERGGGHAIIAPTSKPHELAIASGTLRERENNTSVRVERAGSAHPTFLFCYWKSMDAVIGRLVRRISISSATS
jgi:hypothetical protein